MSEAKLHTRDLLPGDAGVEQTVWHMARLAKRDASNPTIIAIAKKHKKKTDIDTFKSLFDYVYTNYPYVSDPDRKEFVSAPIEIINKSAQYCDCDDLTTLLCSLLIALKYKVVIKTIAWDKERCDSDSCPFSHVYLMVEFDGKYMPLDPVKEQEGFGAEQAPVFRAKNWKVN